MESIYKLDERAAEIAARYDALQTEFECLMDENGGELNDESQEMLEKLAELEAIKEKIREDFIKFPDVYAAWYKNVEAEKKVAEAELKAFEEEQKKAVAKYKSRVRRLDSRLEWIEQNIAESMRRAQVDKLDKKSRPDAMFSIYFQERKSIDVNEEVALYEYKSIIDDAVAKCPEWLTLEPKIAKKVLSKEEVLPLGFERKISRSLEIR